MNNYISNCNLHFEKYIYLFNKYENVQVIFFIPSCEQKNLLRLDKGIFDISGPKINKLETGNQNFEKQIVKMKGFLFRV